MARPGPLLLKPNIMFVMFLVMFVLDDVSGNLIESRAQSRELPRAVRHHQVVVVVEGVREKMTGTPSPEPLILINFPDVDTQFKVHLLEESNSIKLTLAQNDINEVWCEDIVLGPESDLAIDNEADHLLIAFDQSGRSGCKVTVYFSCIGKGQVKMPVALKTLQHRMK